MTRRKREERRRLAELESLELFAGCPEEDLRRIDGLLSLISVKEGATLTIGGTVGRECMVVVEGRATATREGRSLGELGPGSVVGEMSLLYQAPRSATVTARTPMRVFVLNPAEFNELMKASPCVRARVTQIADGRRGADDGAPGGGTTARTMPGEGSIAGSSA